MNREAVPDQPPPCLSVTFPRELIADIATAVAAQITDALPTAAEPWLNVDEAAAHLTCSRKRIYDLVSQGRLRVAKEGRRLLFRIEWLDAAVVGGDHVSLEPLDSHDIRQ